MYVYYEWVKQFFSPTIRFVLIYSQGWNQQKQSLKTGFNCANLTCVTVTLRVYQGEAILGFLLEQQVPFNQLGIPRKLKWLGIANHLDGRRQAARKRRRERRTGRGHMSQHTPRAGPMWALSVTSHVLLSPVMHQLWCSA